MMQLPTSIAEMNNELRVRCASADLPFDCGAGGNIGARIAVVAEAPGDREAQQKQPLIGGSGRLLWDVLRKDNITRNHCYITNVIKRQLVSVALQLKTKKAALPKQELAHWKAILHEELAMLPNVEYIMAMGNYALMALCGETGITKFRGSVLPVRIGDRTMQVVCCFNPAAAMHEPKNEIVFRMDCHKLTRLMKGEHYVPTIRAIINPSFDEALGYLHHIRSLQVPIAYDIETMANETACIGFAATDSEGMCINFRTANGNHYTLEQERDLRLAINRLLTDPTVQLVAQNGTFDATWLGYKDRIHVRPCWFDTMLAHHLLYPGLPHDLGFLTAQYTDYPYYKDEGKAWKDNALSDSAINEFWEYNVKDCCITRICAGHLARELRDAGLEDTFYRHIMRLQPHLIDMTTNGVLCDRELKQQFVDELTVGVEQAKQLCIESAREASGNPDYELNPRSWPALGKLLFEDLRLVGRGTSVDAENRERMRKHPRTPASARLLLERVDTYLSEAKFLGTYADSRLDSDGRFRCEYKQVGVASAPGRLSSSGTMWGNGMNLQNIPERAKGMFIADPGYMFTYFDKSQIEARLVAYFANISSWKAQFERARLEPGSYDAHCALASDMFKVPYDQVPRFDNAPDGSRTIRYVAKRCRHGLNYRMGPDKLATVTGLPIVDAELAYRAYHRTTPEIMQWWDELRDRVRRDRQLVTPFGRRWVLLERFDDAALDSIVAFLPQSTAGDLVASYIYLAHEHPLWPREHARVVLNNHDALITLHTPDVRDLVHAILDEINLQPIIINGEELIIPCEYKFSTPDADGVHRWASLH